MPETCFPGLHFSKGSPVTLGFASQIHPHQTGGARGCKLKQQGTILLPSERQKKPNQNKKHLTIPSVIEGMRKWGHAGGNINWYNSFGEQFTISNKI